MECYRERRAEIIEQIHPERMASEYWFATERDRRCAIRTFRVVLDGSLEVHWHEFYEISLITEGEGTHVLNGVPSPLRRGSLSLLTPADFHEILPRAGSEIILHNLIFSENALTEDLYNLLFRETWDYAVTLTERETQDLEPEFLRIESEMKQHHIGFQLAVRGALERIMIDFLRASHQSGEPAEDDGGNNGIRRALIYLNHHFREPVTLQDAAREAHLSPNYFSACFHRATGLTFQSYLQGLRLNFARSLLSASKLPVTDVCHASGFNSLPHFERVFKEKFGASPTSLRRGNYADSHPPSMGREVV